MVSMRVQSFGLGALFLGLAVGGCFDDGSAERPIDGTGGTNGVPGGGGVGDPCAPAKPCRVGLSCGAFGTCEPGQSRGEGQSCVISGECEVGLQCSGGTCLKNGGGADGESCSSDLDCESGLRCTIVGFSLQCKPEGGGDVGADCATAGDCFAGLTCAAGKCGLTPAGAPSFGVTNWQGVSCESPSAGKVRAFFEVPGATNPAPQTGDFFRLPFPNDVRIDGGKLNLDGFPTPGSDLLGFDPVQRYVDAIVASDKAWGTYPTAIFRFSGAINFDTFKPKSGGAPVSWVDVTAGTPEYASSSGLYWFASGPRTKYVCDNWLGVRRPQGAPLVPGHTYAVWVTTDGKSEKNEAIERSTQLAALLGPSAPSDPVLAKAHTAYAPFRAYLSDKAIDPATILNATVITAGDVRTPIEKLASAIEGQGIPSVKSWVKCDATAKSPCPQADGERACGAPDPAYDEYHALVSLPVFQKGTAPYVDSGGDLSLDKAVRSEDVCMGLTVPKGTMPATGWPVVVFAHGTGGSFRSHMRDEIAGALSQAVTPSGSVGFAVLGIDQVQHGPRRGASTESPNDLFFNFTNPAAARGNPLQGAADQIALARVVAALDVTATETGGADIKADPAKIVFYGHSQGATHGSLALPYADQFLASVLSGNGASLMHALLNKTAPVNIKAAVPFVLGDFDTSGGLAGGDMHPVLSLLQQWIDPADPLNTAIVIGRSPLPGKQAKHVFMTYGLGDHFSPGPTMAAFALAGRLDVVAHDASAATPEAIANLTEKAAPLSGNFEVTAGNFVTLGVRQYGPPSASDGHFVAFDVPAARDDIARFLGMAASGDVPQIGK